MLTVLGDPPLASVLIIPESKGGSLKDNLSPHHTRLFSLSPSE